jgi:hypothetical protein
VGITLPYKKSTTTPKKKKKKPKKAYLKGELEAMEKSIKLRGAFHPHAGEPFVPMTPMTVNLNALALTPRLEPDDRKKMLFTIYASYPNTHSQYHRKVVLTNLLSVPLKFYTVCKRPWVIQGTEHSVPQLEPKYDTPQMTPHGWAKQVHVLPPRENVEVSLSFITPEETEECNPDETDDLTFDSSLVCIFMPQYPDIKGPQFEQVATL